MNPEEQTNAYRKVNTLLSTTAPTYSAAGFMRGTLVKLTIGDYVKDLPGFVTNMSSTVSTNVTWEIARNADGTRDDSKLILPHVINLTVGFRPIHLFNPETSTISGGAKDVILPYIGQQTQF